MTDAAESHAMVILAQAVAAKFAVMSEQKRTGYLDAFSEDLGPERSQEFFESLMDAIDADTVSG